MAATGQGAMRSIAEKGTQQAMVLARSITSAAKGRLYHELLLRYAAIWRSRLDGVTFVGITGSAGKTSAKAMIAAILQSSGSVRQSLGTANRIYHIAEIITATKRSDGYCVLELSAERPGYFDRLLRLVRPAIGVVTTVGEDQYKAFGSREAIAAEKGKLIGALPPHGTAVLNADDPLVSAMAAGFAGRVISFGAQDGADLQARDVRCAWPERLSFTVRHAGEDVQVRTQLCGTHWVTSVLAALAAGVAAGVPLADAAKAVAEVPPSRARMEPVTTPDGITFIRDDWKASYWGMPTVFDFLRDATARRKIAVIGTLSDYHGTVRSKYESAGRQALAVADIVLFVGAMATHGLRARKHAAAGQSLMAFPDVRQASAALQEILQPGDLVLLKGTGPGDHLGRLYHARRRPVTCWRMDCGKDILCDVCPQLGPDTAPPAERAAGAAAPAAAGQDAEPAAAPAVGPAAGPVEVLIGIGNPGTQYHDTPHNVGFAVLDLLAERRGLAWETLHQTAVARMTDAGGATVLLVKPQSHVNNTGKALLTLSKSLGFTAADCVLVQDDIHLPAGTVRARMKGSDGGHLGVRSALLAFQTTDIRRVKIGVAASKDQPPTPSYLISPFPPEVAGKMTEAYEAAAERLLQVAAQRARG